jgi:hypothetical protein
MLCLPPPPSSQLALTFPASKCRCFTARFRRLHRSERRRGFCSLCHEGGWKHETNRGRPYGRVAALVWRGDESRGADPRAGCAPPGECVSCGRKLRRLQYLRRRLRSRRSVLLWRQAARMAELSRGTPHPSVRIRLRLQRALGAALFVFHGFVQRTCMHGVRRRSGKELRLRCVWFADRVWLLWSLRGKKRGQGVQSRRPVSFEHLLASRIIITPWRRPSHP